jgi:thiamine kinase-like enzyme
MILESLISTLTELHSSSSIPSDAFSLKEAYFNKTMQRLSKIEYLIPFAREEYIVVNGRKCRNVYFYRNELEKALDQLKTKRFSFIHGDCTFSNLMIRDNGSPVLIDPRGYFGFTELYGDERYDWAKLYYSIVGNYDHFNLKKFSLDIGGHSMINGETIKDLNSAEIKLSIESNGWEDMEPDFFKLINVDEYEIKLLHAVIWLSLTTYAWQDYDSICGAFYNGLYYLEEVL